MVLRSDSNASSSIPDYDLSPYNSNVWFVPPPANMDDFVSKMDAIVVARVTSVIGSGELNSYNEQDNVRNIKKGDPVSSALPVTDYNLTIERVILAGCGKTLLSTQGRKLSDDKRRPIACSERIIRIGLSHAECRRDS